MRFLGLCQVAPEVSTFGCLAGDLQFWDHEFAQVALKWGFKIEVSTFGRLAGVRNFWGYELGQVA